MQMHLNPWHLPRMRKYNSKNANAFVDATISHRNFAETLYTYIVFFLHVAAAGRKWISNSRYFRHCRRWCDVCRRSATVSLQKLRALLGWWHIPCLIDRFTSSVRQLFVFSFREFDNTFTGRQTRALPSQYNLWKVSVWQRARAEHKHFR